MHVTFRGSILALSVTASIMLSPMRPAGAHPHVYIDGGVDLVLNAGGALTALKVTWRYDVLETLYVFSTIGMFPDPDGTMSPELLAQVIKNETEWPDDFAGAAHLMLDGEAMWMSRPRSVEVTLNEDRLELNFRRDLAEPVQLAKRNAEIAFYEATYYYAFSITDAPKITGAPHACQTRLKPFDLNADLAGLQVTLSALGREETPDIPDVGALFADRIFVTCSRKVQ